MSYVDKYPTPDAIGTDNVLRLIDVSIDLRLWGVVSDAIDSLSNPDIWEQKGALTPEEVAAYFFDVAWNEREMSLAGVILDYVGETVPSYALLCDGSTYLRADYPLLYDAIDPNFHVDANSFRVPDLRDRVSVGASATKDVGDSGGSPTHTLTIPELPAHSHTDAGHLHVDAGHVHTEIGATPAAVTIGTGIPVPSGTPLPSVTGIGNAAIQTGYASIQNTGSGTPFSIEQSWGAVKKIIINR